MFETVDVGDMFVMILQHLETVTFMKSPTSLQPTFHNIVSDGDKYLMLVPQSLFW